MNKIAVHEFQGDDLILECTYDSTSRDNVTTGGISTHEEMCMAFLQYFPKQPDISDSVSR
jgi:hypothetical protein